MKMILFWLYLITPDGNQWAMDSHMSQEDCGKAIAEGFSGFIDEANGWHAIPDGAAYTCQPMTAISSQGVAISSQGVAISSQGVALEASE
jgi:hypothetical protein